MINLLPKNQKDKTKKEYIIKVLTIILWMGSLFTVSVFIPLILSYFIVSSNVDFIKKVQDSLSESEGYKETTEVLKIIKDFNRKIVIIKQPLRNTQRDGLINAFSSIFDKAQNGENSVFINKLSYEQVQQRSVRGVSVSGPTATSTRESGTHKISINGFASSRNDFLAFQQRIQTDRNFLNIDSPVSNLVNENDINFTINITLKDKSI